jgi:hypothetical protein
MNQEELYLDNYLSNLRKSDRFRLLDVRNKSIMPSRVCLKIDKLQRSFLKMPHEFRKKWVTIDDICKFKLRDDEINGECNGDTFGVLVDGRFNGCLQCNNCHVGLWSCNIRVMKTADKKSLEKVMQDLDESLIPNIFDDKESLVKQISCSKYLDDIVIYNPRYSILNESLTSHQPKRRSEGVVKGFVHVFSGEGQGKRIVTLPNYTSYGHHQDNWHGRPLKFSTFLASLLC